MVHVKQIKDQLARGEEAQAEVAIERLLGLGPKNIEALKLKAQLLKNAGKYDDEFGVWEKVIQIDNEDPEALVFFQRRFMEEQERYYFIDELPGQAKRFHTYPRSMVKTSLIGLLSCSVFLFLPAAADDYPFIRSQAFLLTSFGLLVILPWLGIIWAFIHSLRYVLLTENGLRIATRLRSFDLKWDDISEVYVVRSGDAFNGLCLVLRPNDSLAKPSLALDISEDNSSLRAKAYLLKEIRKKIENIVFCREDEYKSSPHGQISL